MKKISSFIQVFKIAMLVTNNQNKKDIVALCSLSPDKNSSLEIKYRSKKNREKEAELDRGSDRQYSTPSTPDYKSERRRGSKVSCTSIPT